MIAAFTCFLVAPAVVRRTGIPHDVQAVIVGVSGVVIILVVYGGLYWLDRKAMRALRRWLKRWEG